MPPPSPPQPGIERKMPHQNMGQILPPPTCVREIDVWRSGKGFFHQFRTLNDSFPPLDKGRPATFPPLLLENQRSCASSLMRWPPHLESCALVTGIRVEWPPFPWALSSPLRMFPSFFLDGPVIPLLERGLSLGETEERARRGSTFPPLRRRSIFSPFSPQTVFFRHREFFLSPCLIKKGQNSSPPHRAATYPAAFTGARPSYCPRFGALSRTLFRFSPEGLFQSRYTRTASSPFPTCSASSLLLRERAPFMPRIRLTSTPAML